jgi:hypothetical protein
MEITEELLLSLSFEKNLVTEEEAGGPAYYYYSLDLLKDEGKYAAICLLSCANDEVEENGGWIVELLDNGHHKIKTAELLKNFISVCKDIENQ